MSFLYSTHAPEAFGGEPDADDMPLTRKANDMADDQSALIENIYDLTMVTTHADSLVSRAEGRIRSAGSRRLSPHTRYEAEAIAARLHTIAARLACAVHDASPLSVAAE